MTRAEIPATTVTLNSHVEISAAADERLRLVLTRGGIGSGAEAGISVATPLGAALVGQHRGQETRVNIPGQLPHYVRILSIIYQPDYLDSVSKNKIGLSSSKSIQRGRPAVDRRFPATTTGRDSTEHGPFAA